ncbi:hypothetical protein SAMN04488126_10921 [Bhargavaea beijingensis]|uniref:Uncharacterized protein n=1 Tax=Bhargavaea beijingensis TaxID=426756 RepID=A0A1G7D1C2_9BACL|nr:hypothetical protein [Bhargavaea beijingensis]SDE45329.1 hypothetical protein SAMN04488126_10921 [Bhargavaea beijingensis]
MAMSAWTMEQTFRFPQGCGEPVRAESVNVTPQYTDEHTENAYRLTGIYHLTCMAVFDGEGGSPDPEGATMIEEIDMDGETGYFEYAVPLYIDLPSETGQGASIKTQDVRAHVNEDGALCVTWKVDCLYGDNMDDESDEADESPPKAEVLELKDESSSRTESSSHRSPQLAVREETESSSVRASAEPERRQPVTAAVTAEKAPQPNGEEASQNSPDEVRAFIAGLEDTYTVFSYPSYKILVKRDAEAD